MSIKISSIDYDDVIKGKFITGSTNYSFAIDNLIELINKLDIQRKLQSARFYKRLEKDIIDGCIMPPLTIAFIDKIDIINNYNDNQIEEYVNREIHNAFILDGIQRLNTLDRIKDNEKVNRNKRIFLNIIICESMDNLLYRMITLNNGQRPMTVRHQIEILMGNIYNFDNLSLSLKNEKDKSNLKESFNKSDIINAYIAFLSASTNIENQKIIESKMNELITDKIINSDITSDDLEFNEITKLIYKMVVDNEYNMEWFKNLNNLIGFCVGIRRNFQYLINIDPNDFSQTVKEFEKTFSGFDTSKIRLSSQRRKSVDYFISNFNNFINKEEIEMLSLLNEME
ncbi:hypothetical protein [Herpetosiphon gulosus]|uniref:DUF262 domain-containing protein n=1 Tax=Herpetosiphon gulosus TaxID=1973496 RepID=A0ABP9WX30_9CHLR